MSKSPSSFPRPLSDFTAASLGGALRAQGFASTEILTRWPAIVGTEIAAHSEPMKINWPKPKQDTGEVEQAEPATLVLRVEGPMALEIQHQSSVILERVNRFFGWQAVGRLALRQAPLRRKAPKRRPAPPDPTLIARLAADMTEVQDDGLRNALARLGTAIKTK